jgi:hypothetical protein
LAGSNGRTLVLKNAVKVGRHKATSMKSFPQSNVLNVPDYYNFFIMLEIESFAAMKYILCIGP